MTICDDLQTQYAQAIANQNAAQAAMNVAQANVNVAQAAFAVTQAAFMNAMGQVMAIQALLIENDC